MLIYYQCHLNTPKKANIKIQQAFLVKTYTLGEVPFRNILLFTTFRLSNFVVMGLLISLGVLPNFCDTVNDTSKL